MLSIDDIADTEDAKGKVVISLFVSEGPLRQAEIARMTGMSPQRIDYNLRELVSSRVVKVIEDEESGKLYMLQEFFYDDTFVEGIAQALSPLAEVIHNDICGESDWDAIVPVMENIRYAVQIAATVLRKSLSKSI